MTLSRHHPALPALALAALLAAPVALAGLHVDHHEGVDFESFATYRWIAGTPAKHAGIEQTLRAAVNRELHARGLLQVDSGADLLVATHASPDGTGALDPAAFVYGGAPWKGWTDHGPVQGALLVDLVDARERILIWRGLSTSVVPSSEAKAEKKVDKLVRKMFRRFPPEP